MPRLHVLDGFKLAKLRREEAAAEIKFKPEEAADITTKATETPTKTVNEPALDDNELEEETKPVVAKKRKRGRSGVVSIENVKKKRKATKEMQDIFNMNENNLLSW